MKFRKNKVETKTTWQELKCHESNQITISGSLRLH